MRLHTLRTSYLGLLPILIMVASETAIAGTQWVLPQLAFGGGWSTTLYLSNTGTAPGPLAMSFYDDSGNAMIAPVNGGPAMSTVSATLATGATMAVEFPNDGPLKQGWISLNLPDGVRGYAVFRQSIPSGQDQEAVVLLAPTGNVGASFAFDNRSLVTTCAVLNPSSSPTLVNVVVRDSQAIVVGTAQLSLQPLSKTAFVLSELPGLAAARFEHGTVDFVTAAPASLAVLGLRFRNSAITSIPVFHGTIGTSQAPSTIPAPLLQATAVSVTTVRLSWGSSAASRIRFRVESRPISGAYAEISQPAPDSTSLEVQNLVAGGSYFFRMRVETTTGLSGYSNEVQITTPTATLIPAPTGLRLLSANQIEVSLAWTIATVEPIEVRVEIRNPGAADYIDIGPGITTGTRVTGLEASKFYSFRVRAKSAGVYSSYSNELSVTTPPRINVFLLHGIHQDSTAMLPLRDTLSRVLTSGRFNLLNAFSFDECSYSSCAATCTISQGAQKLARLIQGVPAGKLVFVGYSLGGLIARDLIVNNWGGTLTGRDIAALITLGSPNLGYPYASFLDQVFVCDPIAAQMSGDFRVQPGTIQLSPYLYSLTQNWANRGFPGTASQWLAAAGEACTDPWRSITTPAGCPDSAPQNDRVVCSQSATYAVSTPVGTRPSLWTDPEKRYVHTSGSYLANVFCDLGTNPTRDLLLNNPPYGGLLVTRIAETLNALQ